MIGKIELDHTDPEGGEVFKHDIVKQARSIYSVAQCAR